MEKIEDVTKVSTKGQVVIPKEIREKLGILPGEKMILITRDEEIILKKAKRLSIEEISERIEKVVEKEKVDIDKLIDEAIKWARSKQS
jgi:AbrB family looped-hinge helix DNA binding protein